MTTASEIPIVDFSSYALHPSPETKPIVEPDDQSLERLAAVIDEAFREYGFLYLVNHGIPETKVEDMQRVGDVFLNCPVSIKEKAKRGTNLFVGWTGINDERADGGQVRDMKEAYNWVPFPQEPVQWPDVSEVPNFAEVHREFYRLVTDLATRILRLLALSLNVEDDFFVKHHDFMNGLKNQTSLRNLLYPPVEDTTALDNDLRLGEHTDGGTFSFLFQDNIGGLEVMKPNGSYIHATPVDGAILVIVADLLQIWSASRYKAVRHRVRIQNASDCKKTRHSTVVFVCPDCEAVVSCFDGSNKYPPTTLMEHGKETIIPRLTAMDY